MKSVSILGIRVDAVSRDQALKLTEEMLERSGQHLIVTPNPEMVLAAQADKNLREILNNASLALPDGAGVLWAANKLGVDISERVTGTDFLYDLAELCARKNLKLALVGAGSGVAQMAAEKLKKKFLGLDVRGFVDENLSPISDYGPTALAAAFGHGKQEKWLKEVLSELPSVKIGVGVGGALDYVSGAKKRAPQTLQTAGLEWLWRLLNEPKRFPRIWNATVRFPIIFLSTQKQNTNSRMNANIANTRIRGIRL